jgi:hypothetical protein
MKTALFAAFLAASTARAVAAVSCAVPDVKTPENALVCLDTFEKLEAWKNYWGINSGHPTFQHWMYASMSGNRGQLQASIEFKDLKPFGYELDAERMLRKNGKLLVPSRSYADRIMLATDMVAALEAGLNAAEAERRKAETEIVTRAAEMDLEQLQAFNRAAPDFAAQRASIETQKAFLATLKAVETVYRRLTIEKYQKDVRSYFPSGVLRD